MRSYLHRHKFYVFGVLLIMLCVQSFAMHFHFTGSDHDHAPQAHAHALGSLHDGHAHGDHEDEASTDIPGLLVKKAFSLDFVVFSPFILFAVSTASAHVWWQRKTTSPPDKQPFLRPPLRAPPL